MFSLFLSSLRTLHMRRTMSAFTLRLQYQDSPTASPEPGINRLLVWDSLWMNWAMLSPLPCCAPKELIMVDSTPCMMPVNNSGLRESPSGVLPAWVGAGPVDWWGSEAPGPVVGGCAETTLVAYWLVQTVFIFNLRQCGCGYTSRVSLHVPGKSHFFIDTFHCKINIVIPSWLVPFIHFSQHHISLFSRTMWPLTDSCDFPVWDLHVLPSQYSGFLPQYNNSWWL